MDEIPLLLTSVFYLVIIGYLIRYSWKDFASRNPSGTVVPHHFMMAAIVSLLMTAVMGVLFGGSYGLFALAFSIGTVLSVLHSGVAVCFLLANSIMRPWEFHPHSNPLAFIPKFMGALCIGSWIFHGVIRKNLSFLWNWPVRIFIALALWILLSALMSGGFDEGMKAFMGTVFVAATLFVLVSNIMDRSVDFDVLRKTLVTSVVAMIAAAIARTFEVHGFSLGSSRLDGFGLTGNANDLGAFIVLATPFALWKRRWSTWIGLSIFILGLILAESRGTFLALALSGLAYLAIRMKNPLKVFMVAAVFLPLFYIAISLVNMSRHADDLEGSSQSRFTFLLAGLNMAVRNPIFGVGFNNYPKSFESYAPSIQGEWGERTAHSTWVLVLAETGFIGFFLFASLYISILKRSWRIRNVMPPLFVSMVGYGVAMSFLSHTYLFFPYLLFAMVLCAGKIKDFPVREERASTSLAVRALGFLLVFVMAQTSSVLAADIVLEGAVGGQKPAPGFTPKTGPALELKGSRGEVLNFLIRARFSSCQPWKWNVGEKHLASAIKLFAMSTIDIKERSFPKAQLGKYYDPLLPIDSEKICADATPDTWIWGELEIPSSLKPGNYTASFELQGKKLPISLRVWKMKMSDQPALPAYSEYSTYTALLGHYGQWHEGEEKLAAQYYREMMKHRLMPLKSFIAAPEISRNGEYFKLDLDKKPVPAQSFSSVTLNLRPKWAYFDFPTIPPNDIETPRARDYFKAVEGSLKDIGRPGKALVYLWDEPHPNDYPQLQKLLKVSKENAPHLKTLVTTTYRKELNGWVDILVPVMDQFDIKGFPPVEDYQKFQKAGGELWLYVSCMSHGCDALADSGSPDFVIERSSSYVRSIGWIASKYRLNGFLYYMVNYAYQFYPKRDPWNSLWDFSGNGDGTLFYPGRAGERGFTQHQPVPSIRLKLWRESSYDAEYLAWMQKSASQPDWFKREFATLVKSPRDWSKDYSAYQALRDRIGDYLDRGSSN